MKQIKGPAEGLSNLIRVPVSTGARRLSTLVVRVPCEDGVILKHMLSLEMLLLTDEEAASLESDEALLDALEARHFVVPEQTNEVELVDQVRTVYRLAHRPSGHKTGFTILTTMDCNARCFYCYELGRPRRPMTAETARKVAAYIVRESGGKKVFITWFGGEPLMGTEAIEIICGELVAAGIEYRSRMVSNALLFDEELVRRAKEQWNLHYVQVTLDGTEEVYNRTKAFVDCEGSAFECVLDNIGLLLDAEITVAVRLNLHADNLDDLLALIDLLAVRFAGRKGLGVYPAMLREDDGSLVGFDSETAAYEAYASMTEHLIASGLASRRAGHRKLRVNRCMADSDEAVVITPEGRISMCEHYSETELVGSVDSDEWDSELAQSWKQSWPATELCRDCPRYPICIDLCKCPYTRRPCDELERGLRIQQLIQSVAVEYRRAVEEDD